MPFFWSALEASSTLTFSRLRDQNRITRVFSDDSGGDDLSPWVRVLIDGNIFFPFFPPMRRSRERVRIDPSLTMRERRLPLCNSRDPPFWAGAAEMALFFFLPLHATFRIPAALWVAYREEGRPFRARNRAHLFLHLLSFKSSFFFFFRLSISRPVQMSEGEKRGLCRTARPPRPPEAWKVFSSRMSSRQGPCRADFPRCRPGEAPLWAIRTSLSLSLFCSLPPPAGFLPSRRT